VGEKPDEEIARIVRTGRRTALLGALFVIAFVVGVYAAVAYFADDGRIALVIPANDPARGKK